MIVSDRQSDRGDLKESGFGSPTIKEMPAEIRPRERLCSGGARSLSDVELVAILLSTGIKGRSAIDISQRILRDYKGLEFLASAVPEELSGKSGIGLAKASRIIAAVEIGRRIAVGKPKHKQSLSSCSLAAEHLMPSMRHLEREHFQALILNTKNELIKEFEVAVGSLNGAIVHPRELFRTAIKAGGAAVIVAHNHPSGDPTPSSEDLQLTKRLADAGRLIGIELIDHIIIGDGIYISLKELNHI